MRISWAPVTMWILTPSIWGGARGSAFLTSAPTCCKSQVLRQHFAKQAHRPTDTGLNRKIYIVDVLGSKSYMMVALEAPSQVTWSWNLGKQNIHRGQTPSQNRVLQHEGDWNWGWSGLKTCLESKRGKEWAAVIKNRKMLFNWISNLCLKSREGGNLGYLKPDLGC